MIRERPQNLMNTSNMDDSKGDEGGLLGLPETETELDVSLGNRTLCGGSVRGNRN